MKKTFFAVLLVVAALGARVNAIPSASGTTTLVVQLGDSAPGISGAQFSTIGVPAVNNSMHLAFRAVVT